MVKFKLSRDQARLIESQWIKGMLLLATTKLNNNAGRDIPFLNCKIVVSLLKDVELTLSKKLINSSKTTNLSFELSDAHGVVFYMYLMDYPIAMVRNADWLFRQKLCDIISPQIFSNRPATYEAPPTSIDNFIKMTYED
jgi:hypothetical protein